MLLAPLSQILDGYPVLAQQRWAAWRRKHRLDDRLPQEFATVLETVNALADPALAGVSVGQTWSAADLNGTPAAADTALGDGASATSG